MFVSIGTQHPDPDREVGIVAETGYNVSEVDVADDQADFADEEKTIRTLMQIIEQFRIDLPTKRGTLVRRKPSCRGHAKIPIVSSGSSIGPLHLC